jgi:hypothetical protein
VAYLFEADADDGVLQWAGASGRRPIHIRAITYPPDDHLDGIPVQLPFTLNAAFSAALPNGARPAPGCCWRTRSSWSLSPCF